MSCAPGVVRCGGSMCVGLNRTPPPTVRGCSSPHSRLSARLVLGPGNIPSITPALPWAWCRTAAYPRSPQGSSAPHLQSRGGRILSALSTSTPHAFPEDLGGAGLCPELEGQGRVTWPCSRQMAAGHHSGMPLRSTGYLPSKSKTSNPPLSLSSSTVLQDKRGGWGSACEPGSSPGRV